MRNTKLFYYDDTDLSYKPTRKPWKLIIGLGLILFSGAFLMGYNSASTASIKNKILNCPESQVLTIGSDVWVDSVFTDYRKRADIYLSQEKFKDSPIQGEMLALAAHNAYDSTGIVLPVELALAQAQLESSMGTKGKSPKRNPYNIGEHDSGTTLWFKSTFDGIQAYYYYMTTRYLKCKSLNLLFKSFTNCSGYRYASNPDYESLISKQYHYNKSFIDTQIENAQIKKK